MPRRHLLAISAISQRGLSPLLRSVSRRYIILGADLYYFAIGSLGSSPVMGLAVRVAEPHVTGNLPVGMGTRSGRVIYHPGSKTKTKLCHCSLSTVCLARPSDIHRRRRKLPPEAKRSLRGTGICPTTVTRTGSLVRANSS